MDIFNLLPLFIEDDEEIALCDYILNTKNRTYHYLDREPGVFNLDNLGESYCYTHFRFYKNDIRQLVRELSIADQIVLKSRVKVSGEEALCIVLHRLSYPTRYVDLMKFFPRGRSALCEIFNHMIDLILRENCHVLKNFNQAFLTPDKIDILCDSISAKGSPYKRCFGFIDGTVKAVCRPSSNQREFYNGHRRTHSIKFQSLLLPNGIAYNLFGSVVGRRHDSHLLARSKLVRKIKQKFNGWTNTPHLYGDSGYPLSELMLEIIVIAENAGVLHYISLANHMNHALGMDNWIAYYQRKCEQFHIFRSYVVVGLYSSRKKCVFDLVSSGFSSLRERLFSIN